MTLLKIKFEGDPNTSMKTADSFITDGLNALPLPVLPILLI